MLTSKLYVSGRPEGMDVTWMMDLEMAGFIRQQKKQLKGKVVYISTIFYDAVSKTSKRWLVIGFLKHQQYHYHPLYFLNTEHCEDQMLSSSGARGQISSCLGDGLAPGILKNLGSEAVSRAGYWSAEEGGMVSPVGTWRWWREKGNHLFGSIYLGPI